MLTEVFQPSCVPRLSRLSLAQRNVVEADFGRPSDAVCRVLSVIVGQDDAGQITLAKTVSNAHFVVESLEAN